MYLRTQTQNTAGFHNYYGVRVYELTQHQYITRLEPWFRQHVDPRDYWLVPDNIVWFRYEKDQLRFLLSFPS